MAVMTDPRSVPLQPITPALAFRNAAGAIDFYTRAFGAREIMRLTMPDGTIAHAELDIAGGTISLAEEDAKYNATPETLGGTSVVLQLYVANVDAFVARAVEAGATVTIPVADQFYGDRSGRLTDPYGYVWLISTRTEDMTPEEMQRRMDAMMRG
jgi:PhnB protein